MLFPKRQDVVAPSTAVGLALGASVSIPITREFHIESMFIVISGTITTGAATMNTDGLAALLQSVSLETADGVQTRLPIQCSGGALLEHCVQTGGALDAQTATALAITTGTGAFKITFPIFFAPRQIIDPSRSFFLLPAPRFVQDMQLRLQLGTQAQIDTNATPTFAATAGFTVRVIVNRRVVSVPNWMTFDTEFKEDIYSITASQTSFPFDIDIPGSYFGILLRGYVKTTGARGDITLSSAAWSLQALGVIMRRARLDEWRIENELSVYLNRFTGSYFLDFLTDTNGDAVQEMSSLLDANIYAATGAKLQLVGDIDGGTSCQLKIAKHRVFGDLSPFRSALRNGAVK